MPTYIFRCEECGLIKDIKVEADKTHNLICVCGGKMDMLVEKKMQFHVYRGTPRIRGWIKEKGL